MLKDCLINTYYLLHPIVLKMVGLKEVAILTW